MVVMLESLSALLLWNAIPRKSSGSRWMVQLPNADQDQGGLLESLDVKALGQHVEPGSYLVLKMLYPRVR
jgi:hypothetical protein